MGRRRKFKKESIYVYQWLIHVDVWQKPTHHGKVIILQLKINTLFFLKGGVKNKKIASVGEDMEKNQCLYTFGNVNWYSHYGNQYGRPQKLKIEGLPWWSSG